MDILDAVAEVKAIRATGGVFRSNLWCQIMAGTLRAPLFVDAGAGGTALGAAALGWFALGGAATLSEAVTAPGRTRPERDVRPGRRAVGGPGGIRGGARPPGQAAGGIPARPGCLRRLARPDPLTSGTAASTGYHLHGASRLSYPGGLAGSDDPLDGVIEWDVACVEHEVVMTGVGRVPLHEPLRHRGANTVLALLPLRRNIAADPQTPRRRGRCASQPGPPDGRAAPPAVGRG